MDRIPLTRPYSDEREVDAVRAVLKSGQVAQGPKVGEFERLVADYVGVEFAVATSSCTTGLHLTLAALGVGPGDEVLLPDFTFPATANVVVQLGATPVLVDIDLETFNIDPEDLEEKITERSRLLMPVHLFGLPADMDSILRLAEQRGLPVLEDAACALGATYRGRPCGTMGTAACFSFHARKIITTGEGGMVVTNDSDLAERLLLLRSHGGLRDSGRFTFHAPGYNYRLSDVQAALGIAQMARIGEFITRRRVLADELIARLAELPGITVPAEPPSAEHIYQSFVVMLDEGLDRDRMITELTNYGIETTLGTYGLHAQPFFRKTYGYEPGDLPRSYRAFRQSLALPFYPQLSSNELDRICDGLRRALALTH